MYLFKRRLTPLAACFACLAFALAFAAPATSDEKPTEKQKPLERVAKIVDVKYVFETSEPPNLIVTAVGEVPTGGWTDVELHRRIYVTPPADGIWEYDLYARPPAGLANDIVTKLPPASDRWEKLTVKDLKGVRVYGVEGGIKEVKFGAK